MSKTIWKYEIRAEEQKISMPYKAQILYVQMQNTNPCIWVMVDPETAEKSERTIKVFGTGKAIEDDNLVYIGTFQTGQLVFHVFESF